MNRRFERYSRINVDTSTCGPHERLKMRSKTIPSYWQRGRDSSPKLSALRAPSRGCPHGCHRTPPPRIPRCPSQCRRAKSPFGDSSHRQRGRDSNPRLTFLPATAFKAVPIGHSGTPPGRVRTGTTGATALDSSLLERGEARRLDPALGLDDARRPARVVRKHDAPHQQADDQAEHDRVERRQQDVGRERTR